MQFGSTPQLYLLPAAINHEQALLAQIGSADYILVNSEFGENSTLKVEMVR